MMTVGNKESLGNRYQNSGAVSSDAVKQGLWGGVANSTIFYFINS